MKQSQQSKESGEKTIGVYTTDAYKLTLKAMNHMLECRASIEVLAPSHSISPVELTSILRENRITDSANPEQLAAFCADAAQGKNLENILIASGLEPIPGKDGWLELIVSTGKEKSEFTEDQQGHINFKLVQSFSNVEPGQQIAINHSPTPGEPGLTIIGETIPAPTGNPNDLIAGDGVAFSEDKTQIFAEKAGRVVFENNTLFITEEFVVNGDVDLNVGHINFNGVVDIKGDVLDDFNITATKGINVTGTVGACRLESDGPITVGSVAGKGEGKITCKGTFKARYLNQAVIECWEDIEVAYEARNSILKSARKILLPSGLLTGGKAIALEGIEAKVLGARAGAKTHVLAGVYFPEIDQLEFLRTSIRSTTEQIEHIDDTLNLLKKKPLSTMSPALREATEMRIEMLNHRLADLYTEKGRLTEELREFSHGTHPTTNPKINVLGSLKEQVIISLGDTREGITMEIPGPLSVVENTRDGGLRFVSYSPLKVSAGEAEKNAIQEAEASDSSDS
ncbi:MAG: DUF342 domain-containing protein [Deltaproteobacteria bacterium]|nr:DUF342 domain-containing protein [Deltaproteobacteria bacterium]